MSDSYAIFTDNLGKSFGKMKAVRGLDLAVKPGRITGFLGRNGAGKSTTIKMLLGMMRPTTGEGTVLGKRIDCPRESVEMRRRVAYVSEDKRLYGYMTVEQIIAFTGSFFPGWRPEVAENLLGEYELPRKRKIKALSRGMRTKLALLLAFARRPELVILDEPSEGLDPVGIEQLLRAMAVQCAEGTTVFFSSHQIADVERVADDVCMMEKGKLVLRLSLDEMRKSYRQIDAVFPAAPPELNFRVPGILSVRESGRQLSFLASGDTEAIVDRARDLHAVSVDVAPVGLRDLFLEMVKER
ncbi:MAG: ABC transporter ATP-binding protein [Acidobacteriota bacterium]|nr:ABC transporter ATP-binding protein [Acidobacteriota bacterium]